MNALLDEMNIREIPSWLVDSYRKGTCTPAEKTSVEKLKNLPVNFVKFLTTPEVETEEAKPGNLEKLMRLAEEAKQRTGYIPQAPLPEPVDTGEETGIEPGAGQIWSVKTFIGSDHKLDVLPIAREQLVFLLTNPVNLSETDSPGLRSYIDDRFVEFLPVSIHTEFANRHDMIIPEGNDILGVGFMIETEINSRMLVQDLEVCHGSISEEEAEKLLNLYFQTHDMEHDYELLSVTDTGEENEESGFPLDEFKQIEFQNAQVIAEPVEKLAERVANLEVVLLEDYDIAIAAAEDTTDVASLVPGSTEVLYEESDLYIGINQYPEHGNFFNINVAREKHDGEFIFRIEYLSNNPVTLEHDCPMPKEYFFPFYSGFKAGLYLLSIVAEGKTIWSGEYMIELVN